MRRNLIFVLIVAGVTLCFASCGDKQENTNQKANNQTSFPQITSFTDYVYEDHSVFTFAEVPGFLRQLDIEFPTGMKDEKVLVRIQEQLIDTLFHKHYHTTHLDSALSKYWPYEPDKLKCLTTYPLTVPNDSDEYFDYGGVL